MMNEQKMNSLETEETEAVPAHQTFTIRYQCPHCQASNEIVMDFDESFVMRPYTPKCAGCEKPVQLKYADDEQ